MHLAAFMVESASKLSRLNNSSTRSALIGPDPQRSTLRLYFAGSPRITLNLVGAAGLEPATLCLEGIG